MFNNGSDCSQAVLATFASRVGLNPQLAHKLGTGLGAGLGRKQYLCGAVTAGAIVLSLKYSNQSPTEPELKEDIYARVHKFVTSMEAQFGKVNCYDLLSIDLTDKVFSNVFAARLFGRWLCIWKKKFE